MGSGVAWSTYNFFFAFLHKRAVFIWKCLCIAASPKQNFCSYRLVTHRDKKMHSEFSNGIPGRHLTARVKTVNMNLKQINIVA